MKKNRNLILFHFIALSFPVLFLISSAAQLPNGGSFFTLFDDAMISMTYGRTLAETGELVWFPGAVRVQGFTNPGWTLYMALLHEIGLSGSNAALAVSITSISLIYGLSFLSAKIVSNVMLDSCLAEIVGQGVAVSALLLFPLTFWSVRGMEVGALSFFTIIFFWGFLQLETSQRYRIWIALTQALGLVSGIIIRIDICVLSLVGLLAAYFLAHDRSALRKVFLADVLLIFGTVGLVFLLQQSYYGEYLPNTYNLKLGGYTLQDRLMRGISSVRTVSIPVILVIASCLAAFSELNRHRARVILSSGAIFFASLAYSIWVGGDAWEWNKLANRYVSVGLPFALICIFSGFIYFFEQSRNIRRPILIYGFFVVSATVQSHAVAPKDGWRGILGVIVLLATYLYFFKMLVKETSTNPYGVVKSLIGLVFVSTSLWGLCDWLRFGGTHVRDDFSVTQHAIFISQLTSEDAVVATVWAGAPGYYSGRRMIDLLGKNDREIAALPPKGEMYPGHNKWDYTHSIWKLSPDMIFQTWRATAQDYRDLERWGYVPLCFGSGWKGYFLTRSKNIRWEKLRACSPEDILN